MENIQEELMVEVLYRQWLSGELFECLDVEAYSWFQTHQAIFEDYLFWYFYYLFISIHTLFESKLWFTSPTFSKLPIDSVSILSKG